MRFKYLGVSFIFFLLFIGCNKEEPETIPNCIEQKIKTLKREAVWNPPAKIYSYTYQNRTVYFFHNAAVIFPANCTTKTVLYSAFPTVESQGKEMECVLIFFQNAPMKNWSGKILESEFVALY
jgi:hypothetical protein